MTRRARAIGAAVLAGGNGRRLGGAGKPALPLHDGRAMLAHVLDAIAAAGLDEVVLCADDAGRLAPFGVPVVADLRPGAGPLGGIAAALAHFGDRVDGTLILPCDVPGIGAGAIRTLVAAFRAGAGSIVVAETGDAFRHPLCAVVDNALLDQIVAALDTGRAAVGWLWRTLGAAAVHFDDEAPFFNVNTRGDLASWPAHVYGKVP